MIRLKVTTETTSFTTLYEGTFAKAQMFFLGRQTEVTDKWGYPQIDRIIDIVELK